MASYYDSSMPGLNLLHRVSFQVQCKLPGLTSEGWLSLRTPGNILAILGVFKNWLLLVSKNCNTVVEIQMCIPLTS